MRIAQLANFVGPTSGGLRRAVDKLGRGYVRAGHERLLIVPGPADSVTSSPESGTIVTISSPALSSGYRMVLNVGKVRQVLSRFQPTSIEVSDKWTMSVAGLWARRHDIGSVLFSHERLDDQASMFLELEVSTPIHRLNRWLARHYDRVVVTTRYSAGEWINTQANLVVVPLGVDLEEFTPAPHAHKASDVKLIHAGRLSREKSPHLAVATAVELDRRGIDVQLNVYGTGPILEELRTLAGDSPVFFHGYLDSRAALAEAYRSADIDLSVCPAETFGLAVLESLACGTPAVTADRGGAKELVDASCAEWASPDPVFLADAVLRLAARLDSDEETIRRSARACAERYPWDAAVEKMLAVHDELY